MTNTYTDIYDFIINDDDEVMLLLYARDSKPQDPLFDIDATNKKAVLYRSQDNGVNIDDLPDEILDILYGMDKLLICELSNEENDDDTQIVNAYEAEIII